VLTAPEPWPFPTHPGAEGRHVLSALGEAVALAFDRELARLDGADRLAEIRTSARRDAPHDDPEEAP
jgi:hypothetical protein